MLLDSVPTVLAVGLAVVAAAWGLRSRRPQVPAVCLFSGAAAGIHALVTPEHFGHDAAAGGFFLAVAGLQLAWAVQVVRSPSNTALFTWGAVVNVAVLALWALSRTAGLPFGPEAGEVEPLGFLDVACAIYEAAVVAGCLRRCLSRRPAARWVARPALG